MLSDNNTQNNNLFSQEKKIIKDTKSCNNIFKNPFNNYPNLSKKDTMYLSIINANDYPIKKFKQLSTKRDWSMNLYNLDIEGSSPTKFGIYTKKIDFTNKNSDIEKSSPSPLFKKIIPSYSLSNEDIQGSKPLHKRTRIKRCTNPLSPIYNLPKAENKSILEDNKENKEYKFIRDNLKIDDIEGTKPKKFANIFLRNTMNKDDIKGSFPKQRYIRKDNYSNFDYSDIKTIKHKRIIDLNPLNPVYNWKYSVNNNKYDVGPIEGNYPKPYSIFKYKYPFNLNTGDIEGTKTDSKNKFRILKGSNSCLNIGDIKGSNHGSLLRGISTKRCLNPLTPNYRYLGEEELKSLENNLSNNQNDKNKIIKTNSFNLEKENNLPNITTTNNEIIKNKNNKNKISINNTIETTTYKNENKTDMDNKINQIISDLNEIPKKDNQINFDKNLYKKPEIYFPLKHDKSIIFIKDKEQNKINRTPNPNLRSFQNIIDSKMNMLNQKNYKLKLDDKMKPYESKMDDFLFDLSMNLKNSQTKLKDNINAYYDIRFPDELKENKLERYII